jgi:hypothetical protein
MSGEFYGGMCERTKLLFKLLWLELSKQSVNCKYHRFTVSPFYCKYQSFTVSITVLL